MIDRSKLGFALGLGVAAAMAAHASGVGRTAPPAPRAADETATVPAPAPAPAKATNVTTAVTPKGECCKGHGRSADHDHSTVAGDHKDCPHHGDKAAGHAHGAASATADNAGARCPFMAGQGKATSGAAGAHRTSAAWVCPMHPEVTSAEKSRCPKCGMFLERK